MAMQYAQGKCYPTQLLSNLAAVKHFSTISTHFLNKSILRSANLARVIVQKKSITLYKESTSMAMHYQLCVSCRKGVCTSQAISIPKKKKQIILRPVHMFSVLISAHVFKMHEKLLIERRVKAQSLSVHIYVFKMHERFWTNVSQNSYTSNKV